MEQEYSRDFFWDTYKKLPEDLKEALFADKNSEVIKHICSQSGLNEEQTASVAKFAGRVLMGLLPLNEFPITIELELNIGQDLAGQINRQIYISIFKHLRVSLNKINDANFKYKDLFTSEADGREEEKRRREEAAEIKMTTQKSTFPSKAMAEFPKPPISSNEKTVKETNPSAKIIKEPPFSYSESLPSEIPLEKEIPVSPAESITEKKEVEKPIPDAPSRNAFEQELQKESIDFPEIPMSFSVGSIPTVAIEGIEEIKKEVEKQKPTDIEKPVAVPLATETTNTTKIPSTSELPMEKSPKMPIFIEDELPEEESDLPKNPFAKPEAVKQSKDPYKEIPL